MDMRSSKYPYRLDVETRLPNGCITTHGYAAHHPAEFPALGIRTRLCPLGRAHRPCGLGKLAHKLLRYVTQTGRNNLIDTGAEHGIF